MEDQQRSADEPTAEQFTAATAAARLRDTDRQRRLQSLQMQRERILSERTSSPHRRSALENALAGIERELERLGWSIHI